MTLLAILLVALYGGPTRSCSCCGVFPFAFLIAVLRAKREHVAWGLAVTFFGIAWIALPLAHAVMLRGLPHGEG